MDRAHLVGTVTDAWGSALAGTVVLLVQDELNAPEIKKAARMGSSWSVYTSRRQTLFATTTANDKGEFQFEFPYAEVDLEPGWYEVKALRDGLTEGTARFWIARATLTQLSPMSLYPSTIYSCESPLIHHAR